MQITERVHYVGVNDRTKHRFESLWALPHGVSYNSYLIEDEKGVALIDTVDISYFAEFLDKIHEAIGDRPIDYVIVNHMEPDHSGALSLIRQAYPDVRIVGNKKTFEMLGGFYGETDNRNLEVKDGSELDLGHHKLRFYLTPMLHWPETMMTYDETEHILFSGDAFGCFGALNGHVVDTDLDTAVYWPEMERYYATILGKYAAPVKAGLKKLSALDIQMICSTHGPVWSSEAARAVETYRRFASGETEKGLVICYGSMYGHTRRVAEAIAEGAAAAGLRKIVIYDLTYAQTSFVLADIFRYGSLAIGGPTYNGGLFPVVDDLLKRLSERTVSGHKLACFGGFAWSGQALRVMEGYNEKMKMQKVGEDLEWKQGPQADTLQRARELGRLLAE